MTAFDPERFETEKYAEYFPELEQAYRRAFETMNDEYDSQLAHAIDQQVLSESEPFFENGEFHVEIPDDPFGRIDGVVVSEDRFEAVLDRYRAELERELARVFDVA